MSKINVSKCIFYNEVTSNEEPYCDIDYEHLVTCKSYPDCYFKQFQQYKQLAAQKTVDIFELEKEKEELKEKFFNEKLKANKKELKLIKIKEWRNKICLVECKDLINPSCSCTNCEKKLYELKEIIESEEE